jgi:hypothetical protein
VFLGWAMSSSMSMLGLLPLAICCGIMVEEAPAQWCDHRCYSIQAPGGVQRNDRDRRTACASKRLSKRLTLVLLPLDVQQAETRQCLELFPQSVQHVQDDGWASRGTGARTGGTHVRSPVCIGRHGEQLAWSANAHHATCPLVRLGCCAIHDCMHQLQAPPRISER